MATYSYFQYLKYIGVSFEDALKALFLAVPINTDLVKIQQEAEQFRY